MKCPLITIIATFVAKSFFIRAIDCSRKHKDAIFKFKLLRDAIEEVGPTSVVQIVTNATTMCRSARLLVQSRYRHIFWTHCCVHPTNSALKDISKIQLVSDLVTATRDV